MILERLWPTYGVNIDGMKLDLTSLFGPELPVVLELGFGMGEATAAMALTDPTVAILAVEVHSPGIVALLRLCEEQEITNLRIAHGDGIILLSDMLAPQSLQGIRAYFPDPWPKARHQKRRLVRPDLVQLVASRLRPGGFFHCATDSQNYAEQMLEVLAAEPMLRNEFAMFAPRPQWRPITGYESRGLAQGHEIFDVVSRRV